MGNFMFNFKQFFFSLLFISGSFSSFTASALPIISHMPDFPKNTETLSTQSKDTPKVKDCKNAENCSTLTAASSSK